MWAKGCYVSEGLLHAINIFSSKLLFLTLMAKGEYKLFFKIHHSYVGIL